MPHPGSQSHVTDDSPVFLIGRSKGLVPLTDSVARKHLKDIFRALCLDKVLTFHDFRRGEASWAFSHRILYEGISTCFTSLVSTWLWVVFIFTLYTVNTQYCQYDTITNTNISTF